MWGWSRGRESGHWGTIWRSWDHWAISTWPFQCHLTGSPKSLSTSWEGEFPKTSKKIWWQVKKNPKARQEIPRESCKGGLLLGVRLYGTYEGESQEKASVNGPKRSCWQWQPQILDPKTLVSECVDQVHHRDLLMHRDWWTRSACTQRRRRKRIWRSKKRLKQGRWWAHRYRRQGSVRCQWNTKSDPDAPWESPPWMCPNGWIPTSPSW